MNSDHAAVPVEECPEWAADEVKKTACEHKRTDGCDHEAVVCISVPTTDTTDGSIVWEPIEHVCATHYRTDYGTE